MMNCCRVDTTEDSDSTPELCPAHPQQPLHKICVENRCLEPLCSLCESDHLEIHRMMNTAPKLMRVDIVQHYSL